MKKLISVLLLAMCAATISAQSGRDIYNRYSDEEGVNAVYISKSMFRLIGKLPAVGTDDEDINLTEAVNSLNGFYLIDSSNPAVNKRLLDDVNKYVKASRYEMLMEVKDDGETVRIFLTSKGDEVTGLVMVVMNGDEFTFINLDGNMSRERLEKALETMNE